MPEVLAEVAGDMRLIVVDEYQDTDPAQEQVLQTLSAAGPQLVVVGDPDQSIYAFRGAEVGGILNFPDRFRGKRGRPAKVLALGRLPEIGRGTARGVAVGGPAAAACPGCRRRSGHVSPRAGSRSAPSAPEPAVAVRLFPLAGAGSRPRSLTCCAGRI